MAVLGLTGMERLGSLKILTAKLLWQAVHLLTSVQPGVFPPWSIPPSTEKPCSLSLESFSGYRVLGPFKLRVPALGFALLAQPRALP